MLLHCAIVSLIVRHLATRNRLGLGQIVRMTESEPRLDSAFQKPLTKSLNFARKTGSVYCRPSVGPVGRSGL